MKQTLGWLCGAAALALAARGEITVTVEHRDNAEALAGFRFKTVPPPATNDAATAGVFTLVDGRRDPNGGELGRLNDGRVPAQEDAPGDNFFFRAGTDGGRLLLDLGRVLEARQVNTYSWHGDTRGPQVYALYASDGQAAGFNARPTRDTDPATCGWRRLGKVDTRPATGEPGGQYGASLADPAGSLGRMQYLLFDISRTEDQDGFGNTFYSEVDVVELNGPAPQPVAAPPTNSLHVVVTGEGKYQVTLDTTEAPDLTEWAQREVAPMVSEWYPKLVALLPSEGFEAPRKVAVTFYRDMGGVADTSGTRIRCAAKWMRQNQKGESKGAILHELIHVVQQYGRIPRGQPRAPGWLVEGLTDYLRFYRYEPQTHGAEISRRGVAKARYDASYRVTANFLNWISEQRGQDFAPKLNAAIRQGRYGDALWTELAGAPLPELGARWKAELEKKLGVTAAPVDPKLNTLTDAEKAAGWQLLFNGRDFTGWHNFKRDGVRPGWAVQEGLLVCADPHDAGDLVTADAFQWFELTLEYNISEGGNSGIMYHVTDQGGAAWATGPEFQLEDNAKAQDPVRCGWLYALYQPPSDPKTDRPLDATKPAGEWNQVRLLISPTQCEHVINGVKYFEYVLGSEDFRARVAKSKFSTMPLFAKTGRGSVALQGDHGQVSFRNIKIRPINPAP